MRMFCERRKEKRPDGRGVGGLGGGDRRAPMRSLVYQVLRQLPLIVARLTLLCGSANNELNYDARRFVK